MDILTAMKRLCLIDEYTCKAIQQVTKRLILPKGTVILSEGQIADQVHFIEIGLVRTFHFEGKREITNWIAQEGAFLWPLPTYLSLEQSCETIQLLERTTLVSIQRHDLEKLKQSHDILDDLERRIMEQYINSYDRHIRILLLPKSKDRLAAYEQNFPDLYCRVPLKYVATYLGIDPATLSRIRANYKGK